MSVYFVEMLKRLVFHGLGLFEDQAEVEIEGFTETRLNLESKGGLAILVGENGCGKSSVFEFIRRCMSEEISKRESRRTGELAFAICEFEFEKEIQKAFVPVLELIDERKISPRSNVVDQELSNIKIYSSIIYKQSTNVRYKFIILSSKDAFSPIMLYQWKDLSNDERKTEYFVCPKAYEAFHMAQSLLQGNTNQTSLITEILEKLRSSYIPYDRDVTSIIKDIYSELFGQNGRVKFVFAHRGVGPMDSSLSTKMSQPGPVNFEDTIARAELFANMLDKLGEETSDSYRTYQSITLETLGHDKYKFVKKSGSQVIMKDKMNPDSETDLLKSPEGVYEAHLFAIVSSVAEPYSTLCFDEPNRCMHPALIDRFRRTVLKLARKKKLTIILTTHSRDFIRADTWHHIYYFKRSSGNLTCQKVPKFGTFEINLFTRGALAIRDALFARRCLFVEGERDVRFVNTFIHGTNLLEKALSRNSSKQTLSSHDLEHIRDTTVIELGGCGNHPKVPNLCHRLKIPFLVLLDGDMWERSKKRMAIKKKECPLHKRCVFWSRLDLEKMINAHFVGNAVNKNLASRKDINNKNDEELYVLIDDVLESERTRFFVPQDLHRFAQVLLQFSTETENGKYTVNISYLFDQTLVNWNSDFALTW